jgi:Peptidase family M23
VRPPAPRTLAGVCHAETVTTGLRPGRPIRPRIQSRAVRAVLAVSVIGVVIAIAVAVVPLLLPPGPRPLFQLPVSCGETWQLGTYPSHGEYDVDLFPTAGEAWGRPVLASYAGTVIEAGINGTLGDRTPDDPDGPRGRGGGYWVKIDHGRKWETLYLHLLEPPRVRVGQEVAQGEQIGRVGSTGDSGAPHLHYEQHRGRQKVETYFDGAPSGITHDDTEYTVRRTSNNCQ